VTEALRALAKVIDQSSERERPAEAAWHP
jgi:hypothetical protein